MDPLTLICLEQDWLLVFQLLEPFHALRTSRPSDPEPLWPAVLTLLGPVVVAQGFQTPDTQIGGSHGSRVAAMLDTCLAFPQIPRHFS
jgi:hypothetical protein